jgi:putative flippase GtrA
VRIERRFIKFLLVGVLNTLFGLGIYALLIWLGWPIWGALIGGNIAGIVFNFFTTGHLIFADVALSRLPRFIAAYLACYLANYMAIRALLGIGLGAIGAQAILTPAVALLSYYLMSRHVFRPDRR